jgi:putative ABC transport system ATP-binding protein
MGGNDAKRGQGAVSVRGLTRRYSTGGDTAVTGVDAVDLDLPAGSAVALCGPSGSGKSTLLHLLGAMDRADSGRITVDGEDVTGMSRRQLVEYRRRVGFVFQRCLLLPALSALDNVLAPVLPYRTDFDKDARGRGLLAEVGLAERWQSLPGQLSGGQQQRIALARALVNDPRLLLADEPTGNLDTATGDEVMDLILQIRCDRGMTVVVATHDMTIAARCDRVIRLTDGRLRDDVAVPKDTDSEGLLQRISRIQPGA